jgi:predicted ATP-grasp superfamily ATP-dependent carboligase
MKPIDLPPVVVMNLSYTGLGIARSLSRERIKVYGLGSRKWVPGNYSRFVNFKISPDSQEEPEALCEFLVDLARKTGSKGVIFPTRDHDIVFLKENEEVLKSHFILPQPGAERLDVVLDKWRLYKAALACAIESPKTVLVESLEQAREASHSISYPAVLKPVKAADWRKKGIWEAVGQTKAIIATNKDDLLTDYVRFSHLQSRVLIQEYIEGDDSDIFTFCSYRSKTGKILASFNTQKIVQRPLRLGTGIVVRSAFRPDLEMPSRILLEHLNFTGITEIEYKRDPVTGKYYLIEINPRLWDQHRLGLCAGVNLPLIAYNDLVGNASVEDRTSSRSKTWIAEYSLAMAVAGQLRHGFRDTVALIAKIKGPLEYAVWHKKDPLPFLVATLGMALWTGKRIFQIFSGKRYRGAAVRKGTWVQ